VKVAEGAKDLKAALGAAVNRLTREQIAAELLRMLAATPGMEAADVEVATEAEQKEALFRHLYLWMRDKPRPGDYYAYLAAWCATPWSRGVYARENAPLPCSCPWQAWHTSIAPPSTRTPNASHRRARTRTQRLRTSMPSVT